MLIVDPTRPVTRQITFQRSRLPNAIKRIPLNFVDQSDDSARHLAIGGQPVLEILPAVGVEVDASHSWPPASCRISSIVVARTPESSPRALSRATASIRRRAFSGDRSR